jgi:hypothetical protein
VPDARDLTCPSARPDQDGAQVFGIVGGSVVEPRVGYLETAVPATTELLATSSPVTPEEVFRISGACAQDACVHFEGGGCSLGSRLVSLGMPVVGKAPRCAVRSTCRWWAENGVSACLRCPAVVTRDVAPTQEAVSVAGPGAQPPQQ